MKIAALISRILLGIIFVFFGLNGFLNFLHAPPIPGPAGQFLGLLVSSHYVVAISVVEVISALLLLSGQFLPLALVLLGPVLVNILLFHTFFQPAGIPGGLVATALWFVIFFHVRSAFTGIFARKV
jgi:putative oxidoreductase